ncbi:MAG: A/G-specific adenine glycosylase [Candidatus Sungbacteria bacterium]|uniref:A/G-specific adenine glycosylase n=1 Tax=Candidatus Sungiibacteriota bacterium TaxID=2750080 RepID=A0A933DT94_9BACT|nr:A/G-specific adenine glycosylase [Candidatus Sungbacteria bacterium]
MTATTFQAQIRTWFRHHRRNLPWRKTENPYRILISEVMLQQTQVGRVLPKYRSFLRLFPTIEALARAPLSRVLGAWQGLGYNRRALYLKRLAGIVVRDYNGRIPSDPELLRRLPGIGPGTAGAISAFAFGKRVAFLETNIRRVFLYAFFRNRRRVQDAEVLAKIKQTLPQRSIREWYYALMDYGALALKHAPNPNHRSAAYAKQPPFQGSRRELRGQILSAVVDAGRIKKERLRRMLQRQPRFNTAYLNQVIQRLIQEKLIASSSRNELTVAR